MYLSDNLNNQYYPENDVFLVPENAEVLLVHGEPLHSEHIDTRNVQGVTPATTYQLPPTQTKKKLKESLDTLSARAARKRGTEMRLVWEAKIKYVKGKEVIDKRSTKYTLPVHELSHQGFVKAVQEQLQTEEEILLYHKESLINPDDMAAQTAANWRSNKVVLYETRGKKESRDNLERQTQQQLQVSTTVNMVPQPTTRVTMPAKRPNVHLQRYV